ncbi:MAG: inorganic phosphate transporter [Clostridia bacterium]|nr:inorganic phosphate transporter [Clostridia bacterium]
MQIDSSLTYALVIFLILGVVLVNGATDAPNAISSAVSTRALKMWQACLICGVCNFASVILFCVFSHEVADTVFSLVEFKTESGALIAILSTMITTILFGVVTSRLGMPSSESHAMLSSLFGASFLFGNKSILGGLGKIILYAVLSCVLAFLVSLLFSLLLKKHRFRSKAWLILSTALISAMHGAQDGQKLVGIMLLFMVKSYTPPHFFNKYVVILLVALFMLLGSLICGKRIIQSLGENTIKLDIHTGLVSDLGGFLTLVLCSLLGMPISTGNVKTFSLIGTALAEGKGVNKKTVAGVIITSIATVPVCFIFSLVLTKLFCYFL